MSEDTIVEIFSHNNRQCVIYRLVRSEICHNGYVELLKHEISGLVRTDQISVNVTFEGSFAAFPGKYFIGFDTGHIWNTTTTQTHEYAREQTIILAEDLDNNLYPKSTRGFTKLPEDFIDKQLFVSSKQLRRILYAISHIIIIEDMNPQSYKEFLEIYDYLLSEELK